MNNNADCTELLWKLAIVIAFIIFPYGNWKITLNV